MWKSIIDANGGLTTQPNSIYDKLGIKVNINVINDATQSSNALISGNLNAAGYTVNRLAFLSNKFQQSKFDVVMPYITNYSNGGDGIIAKSSIQSVNDLIGAKIGVPEFSEAQTLVVWFVNQSDLTDAQKKDIINNMILFETPDETAKAFFAGQIDVAATWQPYLTQAQTTSNCHILFSTANSTKLVMDGITFSKTFADANPDVVQKFIDGSLQASSLYATDFSTIKKVMPMFSGESDADIKASTDDANLATWSNNKSLLSSTGDASTIFNNMCDIWTSIGETVNKDLVKSVFDSKYIDALASEYQNQTATTSNSKAMDTVTNDNKNTVLNTKALLSKSVSINFMANTAKFTDSSEATASLDSFIKIAKTLDGSIIQIEGNIASDNDDADGVALSLNRAETVKQYFILNGIDANRIVTVGNGGTKPVAPNDSEDNMAKNRRTDISFKCIEQ